MILSTRDLTKSFGHVHALRGISFRAEAGEVIGLLGDNGAGKSTLVKIISGLLYPDSGGICIDGQPQIFQDASDARDAGVETVHQQLALATNVDVTSNLFLNRELRHKHPLLRAIGWMDQRKMREEAVEILAGLSVDIRSVRQTVADLSGGQRQGIAVGRAVGWGNRIVLMDEPVAALGVEQTRNVLELIRRLQRKGILVVLITHNMEEVMAVCSRAIILRRGSLVADVNIADVGARDLVDYITGAA